MEDLKVKRTRSVRSRSMPIHALDDGINEVIMGRDVRLCDSCRDSTSRLSCDRSAVYSRYTLSCTRYSAAH